MALATEKKTEIVVEGNEIIRTRSAMGMTSRAFASALGVSHVTVYRWEAADFVKDFRSIVTARTLSSLILLPHDELVFLGECLKKLLKEKSLDYVQVFLIMKMHGMKS